MLLYGIKNCDTVKKARKWLDEHEIPYEFHDFRDDGLNPVQLREWVSALGWETFVNKRSTTWRNLPDETKSNMDEMLALAVMEDQPTLIKRPVLVSHSKTLVGFSEKTYQTLLNS
jgi:Spx/MgsR family transcriptional regulator